MIKVRPKALAFGLILGFIWPILLLGLVVGFVGRYTHIFYMIGKLMADELEERD